MEADIHTLYESDFYRVLDFQCRCSGHQKSKPEYSDSFSISFVRKGNFLFNTFRHSLDSYTGCVLVVKPGYERTVTHVHTIPDECSIFEFKKDFYRQLQERYSKTLFFRDNDLHSTLVHTDVDMEFFLFNITRLTQSRNKNRLMIDTFVMQMVTRILTNITNYQPNKWVDSSLKKNHLTTVEQAKYYIKNSFQQDISLAEISKNCYVSPFHFSRIFKKLTSYSPHQFLLNFRLQHAQMLLSTSEKPVTEVAFSSGFNSLEHFSAAFRKRFGDSPSEYKQSKK